MACCCPSGVRVGEYEKSKNRYSWVTLSTNSRGCHTSVVDTLVGGVAWIMWVDRYYPEAT